MLGNNYAPEFFDGLNNKAESPLKRICEETLEDLEGFKKILQDFGVTVIQPNMDQKQRFLDNPSKYPRGPLQPRDYQVVLGNKAWTSDEDHPAIAECLRNYGGADVRPLLLDLTESEYELIAGADYPCYHEYLMNIDNKDFFMPHVWSELKNNYVKGCSVSSAMSFPLGNRIDIGVDEDLDRTYSFHRHFDPENLFTKVNFLPMKGHSDGNFHPIKPGAILSLYDVQTYADTFPGWDVCYLPEQSWAKVEGFLQIKKKNAGKWYLAGEEDNSEFTHFVESWLQDWVGYVEETVFDVNVLMLDEYNCCISNPHNEQIKTFFKKHKIEPVYVPWRHRYFWDGGLHCITLELYREGIQQDYFNY